MRWFELPRVPESEIPTDDAGTEVSAPAMTRRHLEALDDAFVDLAAGLGVASGVALDLGTGSGQIAIKLALRLQDVIVHAIDPSDTMLRHAAEDASRWGVDLRILFQRGDPENLPFDPGLFDLVLCDSILRRSADPVQLVREMARVAKPGAALLLRDLRRPSRIGFGRYLRKHGRHYVDRIRDRFEASVRASYTLGELRALTRQAGLEDVEVKNLGPAHVGFVRRRTAPS